MKRHRPRVSLALLGLGAMLAVCLSPAATRSAENLQKVRLAYPTVSMGVAPVWIAKDAGLFREEGLDVEILFINSGTTVVQALIGGSIEFGISVGAPPIVSAIAQGADLTIPAVPGNRLDYVLVSRHPVRDPRELVGKRLAVSALGSSSEIVARIALERLGVNPDEVIMLGVGGSPLRIGALSGGHVDAAVLSVVELLRRPDLHFHVVLDLARSDVDYPYNTLVVSKVFAAQNRNVVLGMIRGLVKGLRFMRNHREESSRIAAKWLKATDTDALDRQWRHVAFHLWQELPYPTEPGFLRVVKGLVGKHQKVAGLRMTDVFDLSFVEELQGSGFFASK